MDRGQRNRIALGLTAGGAILLLMIVVAAYRVAGGFLERKALSNLSPKQREEFEIWIAKPLTFDPADLEAAPFRESTVAAATAFRKAWEEKGHVAGALADKFKQYEASSEGTTSSLSFDSLIEGLAEVEPLLIAFENLAAQPDYEIDALPACVDPPEQRAIPIPYFRALDCTVKLLHLKTLALAREGRHAEALATAERIVQSSKAHRFSILISRLMAVAGVLRGARAWQDAVLRCNQPELLRQTLARQNELAPMAPFIARDVPLNVSDQIGEIRAVIRRGIDMDVQGLTGQQITAKYMLAQAEYLEKVVLPTIKENPVLREEIESSIASYRSTAAMTGGKATSRGVFAKGASLRSAAILFAVTLPNSTEAYTRDLAARCRFDLLRLVTAEKLFTLEHGREPKTLDELVPKYLPEVPEDLFDPSGRPYQSVPFVYSVGPDRIDQRGLLLYDPTNGITSPGDWFFPPPKQALKAP